MGANDPCSMARLGPRDLIGRIYAYKYISYDPHGFREDFLSFSHYKSMGASEPGALPVWAPEA